MTRKLTKQEAVEFFTKIPAQELEEIHIHIMNNQKERLKSYNKHKQTKVK
jgi:hypothetical protein